MSINDIARHLKAPHQSVRRKCCERGLKKMEMEYWTREQVSFLRKYYKTIGDKELVILFKEMFPKNKIWTIKHIEKKRLYLGLKRTFKQLKRIKTRNKARGCWMNTTTWKTRGVAPEGTIRFWRWNRGVIYPVIKINGKFVFWNVWAWETNFGKVPKGYFVATIGDPFITDIFNLKLMPEELKSVHSRYKKYPETVYETALLISKIKNKIKNYEKQTGRHAQSPFCAA
ncbi:MAG: hypothetical protein ACKVPJ_13605 [Chitinophagales bacterium]